MKGRWKRTRTCVYNTSYHVIFCSKYRKKILTGKVERRLKELIREKCLKIAVVVGQMEVMPDHVHLFLRAKPFHRPHYIVGAIKGYTSHILRKEFPFLKKKSPTLWTRSYYVESIGHISQRTIKQYIADQKQNSSHA